MTLRQIQYVCFVSFLLCMFSPFVHGKAELVTCGSILKLVNLRYKVRLHSQEINYFGGSEHQSVSGTKSQEDINSHWVVKGKLPCFRGDPVKCKDEIRLTHLTTGLNLNSGQFPSPLSRNQEISAYKDDDLGELWTVMCEDGRALWRRDDDIMLRHVTTDVYLAVSGRQFGHPIEGQFEVVGVRKTKPEVMWRASEGVFIHPAEANKEFETEHEHSEL